MMTVTVNSEKQNTTASLLSELLDELGYGEAVVATALNGNFVPQTARNTTAITPGDQIEILAPMQGG